MCYCKSFIFRGYYILRFSPMNVIPLELIFGDFAFVTLLQCTAKMFAWYLISWKQFIRAINPTQNLRLLQYFSHALIASNLWNYCQYLLAYHKWFLHWKSIFTCQWSTETIVVFTVKALKFVWDIFCKFRELTVSVKLKYHSNDLAVHCNNVTTQNLWY